jgi:hypothetical protein
VPGAGEQLGAALLSLEAVCDTLKYLRVSINLAGFACGATAGAASALRRLSALERLDLSLQGGFPHPAGSVAALLPGVLPSMPRLTHLHLKLGPLTHDLLGHVQLAPVLTRLRELSVCVTGPPKDARVAHLIGSAAPLASLTRLHIGTE